MRLILSWMCYWIGDLVSRTIEPMFGWHYEWPYRFYSWWMVTAHDLQGGDPRGPWSDAPTQEAD